MNKKLILMLIFIFMLAGCNTENKNDDTYVKIAELQKKATALQSQVNALIIEHYFLKTKDREVAFTPSSKGYSTLNTAAGSFVVSLEKLVKYANGYKATFNIGNPNLVRYDGVTAILRWGKPFTSDQNFFDWDKSLKSQEIKVGKSLLPGVWNKVDLILSPATAEETGFLGVSMNIDNIILLQDVRKTRE